MSFNHNFSKNLLAINEPMTVTLLDDVSRDVVTTFKMRFPSVAEIYGDQPIQILTSLLSADITELQKQFIFIEDLSTHFQLFNVLLKTMQKAPSLKYYIDNIIGAFQTLLVPITHNGTYFFINGVQLTFDVFQHLKGCILESLCQHTNDAYAAIDERYAEAEKKINKIKKSNVNNNKSDLIATIASIVHEFHLSISEIKNMNFYQFTRLAHYVPSIVNYNITTIAAGNGLTKKLKYFTEGGKK